MGPEIKHFTYILHKLLYNDYYHSHSIGEAATDKFRYLHKATQLLSIDAKV